MSEPQEFEQMEATDEDGWTEWIHPLPGYLMKCCDCGLVHEMDARVGRVLQRNPDNPEHFGWDDEPDADLQVMFRMRRK